jgi:hypothetical protein
MQFGFLSWAFFRLVPLVNRQITSDAVTWLQHPCDWRLLRGGLCAAEYDEKILWVCASTNSGTAKQNASRFVLHENEDQNSGPERSCTDLGDAKT